MAVSDYKVQVGKTGVWEELQHEARGGRSVKIVSWCEGTRLVMI